MFNEEFKKLKKNVGSLLSFNSLLSTSSSRDVSLRLAQRSLGKDDMVAVLFEMHIAPTIRSTPFASLLGISYYATEAEVLFSMHSVFRIREIEHMHNRIWHVRLTLTSDDDPQLRVLTDFMRQEIRGPNAVHRLGSYMIKVQQWDKAREIYEVLLRDVRPSQKNELAFIEHNLGWICEEKNDIELSLAHYQKSLDIEMSYLPSDHPQLAPTYANLAVLYEKQDQFDLAMEQYRRALTIELRSPSPNKEKIASRYMNMGDLLRQLGRLDEALKSVKSALNIRLDTLPPTHPALKLTYGHLFDICLSMGNYPKALEYARKSLEIARKCHLSNDMAIATSHNNVSAALGKLELYKEALTEAEQAMKIGLQTYPSGHPELRIIENSLNALRSKNRQLFGNG